MSRKQATLILAILMVVGLALRLVGSSSLLPHHPEPDTYISRQSDWSDGEATVGKYPLLLVTIDAALPFGGATEVDADAPVAEHLESAAAPFLKTRRWFSVLSMLLVLCTYWIGRYFFRRPAAVFAAALVALNPLLIAYANQARPHVPTAALASLGVVLCLRALRTKRTSDLMLAGLSTGLAAAAFQAGIFAFGSLGVVFVASLWQKWPKAPKTWAVTLAMLGGLLFWSYQPKPPAEEIGQLPLVAAVDDGVTALDLEGTNLDQQSSDQDTSDNEVGDQPPVEGATNARGDANGDGPVGSTNGTSLFGGSQHRVYFQLFNGGGFLILARAIYSHSPLLLLFSSIGALVCLLRLVRTIHKARKQADPAARKQLLQLLTIAGYAGGFLLVFGIYAGSNERFFVALIPYLALLAAALLSTTERLASNNAVLGFGATILAAFTLILPGAVSSRIAWLRVQPDSFQLAARWLEKHGNEQPPGRHAIVFVGSFGYVPLPQVNPYRLGRSVRRSSIWGRYLLQNEVSDAPLAFFYIEPFKEQFRNPREARVSAATAIGRAELAVIYASKETTKTGMIGQIVRERGKLVHKTPNEDPGSRAMKYDLGPTAFLDVWKTRRLGAPLEIFSLETIVRAK